VLFKNFLYLRSFVMKASRLYIFGVVALAFVAGCAAEKTVVTEPKPSAIETPRAAVPQATPVLPKKPAVAPTPAPTPVPATPAGDVPFISFQEPVHDFGSVGPSSANACDFVFTNTGKAVLKIERFHAPCGCTIPELEKKEYAPGESGTIKVRYNAPASAATDKKPIYVYSNDPKNPQFELTIKAQVVVNVAVSPEDVSLLLNQENAGMPTLTVKSTDGKEFSITSVSTTNEVMTIPFDAKKRGSEIVLEPKVDIAKLHATPTGIIQVRTDHPQSGILMVRYNAKPLFEVSRPRIILQNIVPGEEILRDVWIRSNYDEKVEIKSHSSTSGMMTIDSQKQEGNHLLVMVKIVPPTDAPAAGRRYITDELVIKLADGHDVSIRCSGWFKLN
jgi:hypothetical protein